MKSSTKPTFKQLFIEKTGGNAEHFTRDVLWRTLPIHARILLPFARIFDPAILAADYDLIEDIGLLSSRREFSDSASSRRFHPANHGFLRKAVRIRVSISKLHRLVYNVMRPAVASGQRPHIPFPAETAHQPAQ